MSFSLLYIQYIGINDGPAIQPGCDIRTTAIIEGSLTGSCAIAPFNKFTRPILTFVTCKNLHVLLENYLDLSNIIYIKDFLSRGL